MREAARAPYPSHEEIKDAPQTGFGVVEDSPSTGAEYRRRTLRAAAILGALSLLIPAKSREASVSHQPIHSSGIRGALVEQNVSLEVAPPKDFVVLADEVKQVNPEASYLEMQRVAETGANAVEVTARWVHNMWTASDKDLLELKNAESAADLLGLKMIVKAYPCSHLDWDCKHNKTPLDAVQRGKFKNWVANLAYSLPEVEDFIIGNEVNSWGFWWPQHYKTGGYAAAESYLKLLAGSYDVLKKTAAKRDGGKNIKVYGLALASKGTAPPLEFLENFREAYLDSIKGGRVKPVMDVLAFHPYGDNSAQMPDVKHNNGRVGMADYKQLVRGIRRAFAGTPQSEIPLKIAYDEYGIQTDILPSKANLYTGKIPPNKIAVTEEQQAKNLEQAMEMADCQDSVESITNFLGKDESRAKGWQSGLRYPDGTAKSTLAEILPEVEKFKSGGQDCSE